MRKEGLKMDSKEKTKRIYHVTLDVIDDIKKVSEENDGDDSDFLPDDWMLENIKRAIKRFRKIEKELDGVYIANAKISIPYVDEKEGTILADDDED